MPQEEGINLNDGKGRPAGSSQGFGGRGRQAPQPQSRGGGRCGRGTGHRKGRGQGRGCSPEARSGHLADEQEALDRLRTKAQAMHGSLDAIQRKIAELQNPRAE